MSQKIAIAFEDLDPETQVGVNVQQIRRFRYAQVFQTFDDGVVRIGHGVSAQGDFPDPVSSDADTVTAEFGALAPFVDGGPMSWTKEVPDIQDGPRCRRANFSLTGGTGSIDVDLDSGPVTIDVAGDGFLLRRVETPAGLSRRTRASAGGFARRISTRWDGVPLYGTRVSTYRNTCRNPCLARLGGI